LEQNMPASIATDRDLVINEPSLFEDVAWLGQRLADQTCSISGTTLTLAFPVAETHDLGDGHVVSIAGSSLEVVERLSASALVVSLIRGSKSDPPLPPPARVPGTRVQIVTFAPQLGVVHSRLLRALGIDDLDADALPSSALLNPEVLRSAESLDALALIYNGAAGVLALRSADSPLWAKAEHYSARAADERRSIVAKLDVDGDGRVDVVRRLSMFRFTRA
jgi:hypothetical protein